MEIVAIAHKPEGVLGGRRVDPSSKDINQHVHRVTRHPCAIFIAGSFGVEVTSLRIRVLAPRLTRLIAGTPQYLARSIAHLSRDDIRKIDGLIERNGKRIHRRQQRRVWEQVMVVRKIGGKPDSNLLEIGAARAPLDLSSRSTQGGNRNRK